MEKQKAQEVLLAARERGAPVCLYDSCYSTRFSAGFVLAVSENYVVIESLSPRGFCDGWLVREMEDLCRIDCNGRYEEKLMALYRARGETHRRDFLPATDLSSDLKAVLLQAALEHDYAARIDTGSDEDIEGFVREVGLETVVMEKYTEYGQADGDCFLSLEDVQSINVHDDELQDLKLLARWHDTPPL